MSEVVFGEKKKSKMKLRKSEKRKKKKKVYLTHGNIAEVSGWENCQTNLYVCHRGGKRGEGPRGRDTTKYARDIDASIIP